MTVGEKLKLIRAHQQLTQADICGLTGIKLETWKGYEYGRRESVSSNELLKITEHPRFTQYTMWLMTGKTIPEAGQISPV